MKRILILLLIFTITTVGVVIASITKKQKTNDKIEIIEIPQSKEIKRDLTGWD